jgi:hypothetical protein
MASAMMNKDIVSWDRKVQGATDELGHPSESSASGFPQAVHGNMQYAGTSKSSHSAGFVKQYDAVFFTERFHSGILNDHITFSGVTYRVSKVAGRANLFDSNPRFSRYELIALTV